MEAKPARIIDQIDEDTRRKKIQMIKVLWVVMTMRRLLWKPKTRRWLIFQSGLRRWGRNKWT